MRNVVIVAENEEACKLLDCFVSYNKLVAASQRSGKVARSDGLAIVVSPELTQVHHV